MHFGRARQPFHPQKLYDWCVKNFLLQEVELYEDIDGNEDDAENKVKMLQLIATPSCSKRLAQVVAMPTCLIKQHSMTPLMQTS